MLLTRLLLSLLALYGVTAAVASEPFAGSRRCTPCHRTQAEAHSQTGHAFALSPAGEHRLKGEFPLGAESRRGSGFRFRFDRFTVRIDNGEDVLAVPMEWAFGSGAQAVTFVSRGDDRHFLEHYLTYYQALRAFGPTPGQAKLTPANLAEAAGLLYKVGDAQAGIEGCFGCHSAGGLDSALKPFESGVQCEACHGGGLSHVGKPATPMDRPGRGGAGELNEFCGGCHRPPASDPAKIDWNFAWNVRHQPVYFSQSACFTGSKDRLSCVTCHPAHQALRTDAAFYDAQCVGCHDTRPAACEARNCAGCHMPRVSPEPPLRFTNHWIGVYGPGAHLKPVARKKR
jgi:hypothetical protein